MPLIHNLITPPFLLLFSSFFFLCFSVRSFDFRFQQVFGITMKWSIVSAVSLLVASAAADHPFLHKGRLVPPIEASDEFPAAINATANTTGSAFFTQLLDHDDPSKGTFQQKFWWNSEFWAGPGSPVRISTNFLH